jgi:hypothetical protein
MSLIVTSCIRAAIAQNLVFLRGFSENSFASLINRARRRTPHEHSWQVPNGQCVVKLQLIQFFRLKESSFWQPKVRLFLVTPARKERR